LNSLQEPHQTSAEPVVVVGAASKGIIKRDQQNNAIVYKSYYAQNPFAHMDNDEIEKYKREVEQNQMREQGKQMQTEGETDLIRLFFVQHGRKIHCSMTFERVYRSASNAFDFHPTTDVVSSFAREQTLADKSSSHC
jgi:hypothetical protein